MKARLTVSSLSKLAIAFSIPRRGSRPHQPSLPHCSTATLPHSLATLAFLVVLLPSLALGDAIVITQAMTASTIVEIFIEESSIRMLARNFTP